MNWHTGGQPHNLRRDTGDLILVETRPTMTDDES
jgi:hypothetical protein